MKTKKILKAVLVALVFAISTLGLSYSSNVKQVAGKQIVVKQFDLGQQAKAYCNEAQYPGENNNGKCSGTSFLPESRCLLATSGENCTGGRVIW